MNKLSINQPEVKSRKPRIGKAEGPYPHVGIQRSSFSREAWAGLSVPAKILYPHLKAKYNGSNNGEIKLSYRSMKNCRGCSSPKIIKRAFKELDEKDWINIIQSAGPTRFVNTYELTFKWERYAQYMRPRRKKPRMHHAGILRSVLFQAPWRGLGPIAKILYWLLKAEYNGSNNGEIKLSYRSMKNIVGCSCHSTLSRAFGELEAKGWIERTEQRGLFKLNTFYKLTFKLDFYAR